MLKLLWIFAAIVLGLPGLAGLAWAFWRQPWLMVLCAAAVIAATLPWHRRWKRQQGRA